MKKLSILVVVAVILMALVAMPVMAAGKNGQSGSSSTGHVYLYEKDPSTWQIVDGGAWGKFNYSLSGTGTDTAVSGVFNGKGLEPGVCYALINYIEPAQNPWPAGGVPVICIGTGVANAGGNIHIKGTATIGSPDTQPNVGDYIGQTGDKIWLVPCDDLNDDMDKIEAWHPGSILFESALINTP